MKKIWILCFLMAGMTLTTLANPITRSEARRVAQELVGIDDNSGDDAEILPYYIFSRGEGRGFVIASGDDSTTPILGYTETGNFDEQQLPEQLVAMLQSWKERISQVQKSPQTGPRRAPRARAIASYKKDWEDVPALVKTHWHQSTPYNNLAPIKEGVGRCMTGCVATAGSQVTYYFHKDNPNELQYDTPTYGYGTPITVSLPKGTPIRWDLMKLSGSGSAAQNEAVATLMYALGTSAWLTYGDGDGLATSGHNYKMGDAMKGQFHLNYKHSEKSSMSQQSWETTIYNNLKNKQPMLYSGVHPESGGHSVVLDGYQKSTGLYHFNFGWGGQGDGWYTVDDATGMNGFNTYQDLVYNITPQVQNLAGELAEAPLYHKAPNQVEAVVKNNGTLDYSQLYVYTNTKPTLPSQVAGSDTKTVIESGKEARLTFNVTPTTGTESIYVFLCDKSRHVLDTCEMQLVPTLADLTLNSLTVDAGDATMTVDDMTFHVVNNTSVNICANLTNGANGTYCMPAFQCFIDQYDQEKKEWTLADNIVVNTVVFEQGQTQDVVMTFGSLTEDKLYRARMNKSIMASKASEMTFPETGNIVYFTVRKADLQVVKDGRNATVTGHWNAQLFSKAANDATVCSYDITGLTELNEQPVAANPNALFYADTETEAMKEIKNIVIGNQCRELVIQWGADFAPTKAFTAGKASFVMPEAVAGKWRPTFIPFQATVPFGMQVKQYAEWNDEQTLFTHTLDLDPFTPLLCLTGHNGLNTIEGENVSIISNTTIKLHDDQLVCSTVGEAIEPTWLVMGEYRANIFFNPAGEQTRTVGFEPYIVCTTADAHIATSNENVIDAYYVELSKAINTTYESLAGLGLTPQQTTAEMQNALHDAEHMLTYRSGEDKNAITNQRKALNGALKTFMDNYTQGIEEIEAGHSIPTTAEPMYYDLTGKRIMRPSKGLFIMKTGTKTRKILIK